MKKHTNAIIERIIYTLETNNRNFYRKSTIVTKDCLSKRENKKWPLRWYVHDLYVIWPICDMTFSMILRDSTMIAWSRLFIHTRLYNNAKVWLSNTQVSVTPSILQVLSILQRIYSSRTHSTSQNCSKGFEFRNVC